MDDRAQEPETADASAANPGQQADPDLPLETVIARANQLLARRGAAVPRRLAFEWENISFTLRAEKAEAGISRLLIDARLGRLPYTAEDAAARSAVIAAAVPGNEQLPGRLTISADGEVCLAIRTEAVKIEGLADLLKEATCVLLAISDQLKLLSGLLGD